MYCKYKEPEEPEVDDPAEAMDDDEGSRSAKKKKKKKKQRVHDSDEED